MWKSKIDISSENCSKRDKCWGKISPDLRLIFIYLSASGASQWSHFHWTGQDQFSVLSYFIQFGTEIIRWISEYYRPRSLVDSSLRFSLLWLRSLSYNFLPERPYFVQEQKDHFSTHLPSVFLILGIIWEIDSMTILNFK